MIARSWGAVAVLLATGCVAPDGAGIAHDDPALPLARGNRAEVRSDLPPELAEAFVAHLEALELALDSSFPWLEPTRAAPLTLVLADPARFSLVARDHGTDATSGAFVCRQGEVVLRYREEDWREAEGPQSGYSLEPRIRPLAAASLRRRLGQFEDLEDTWVEEGLTLVFVEVAAVEFKDVAHAVRQNRERLLDAFLPLYLGGESALVRVLDARGRNQMKRHGSRALAWAVVRFLLADAKLTPLVHLALREASGEDVRDAWDAALETLAAHEAAFERYLLDAVLRELLIAFRDAPTQVDRWESAAALRLIANVDLDAEAGDRQRAAMVAATEVMFAREPVAPRFLDKFAGELQRVGESRSRLQAQARLGKIVRTEFERRAAGYGHPAVERARKLLGRVLQGALQRQG